MEQFLKTDLAAENYSEQARVRAVLFDGESGWVYGEIFVQRIV